MRRPLRRRRPASTQVRRCWRAKTPSRAMMFSVWLASLTEMLAGTHLYGRHGTDAAPREGIAPQPVAGLDGARWGLARRPRSTRHAPGGPPWRNSSASLPASRCRSRPRPSPRRSLPAEPPPVAEPAVRVATGPRRGRPRRGAQARCACRHRGRSCAPARHPDRALQHDRREPGSACAAAEAGGRHRHRPLPRLPRSSSPSPAVTEAADAAC